jgi:hydroxymethylpyrimidine/phosphomethylpyrimidine kinase
MAKKLKFILTIAGSDSSAGAGIQSDLKTFSNHGLYGLSVITAATAQNTLGVQSSFELPPEIIEDQLRSIFDDFNINVIKTGMLSSAKVINVVYDFLRFKPKIKLVVDPAIISKNGFVLLNEKGVNAMLTKLLMLGHIVTPNLYEAEVLSGIKIGTPYALEEAAKSIHSRGCRNVLIKGGHFPDEFGIPKGTDVLYNGEKFSLFKSAFIKSANTHGIGCVYAASIASNIALGETLKRSIVLAKAYVIESLRNARRIGKGIGPVEQV